MSKGTSLTKEEAIEQLYDALDGIQTAAIQIEDSLNILDEEDTEVALTAYVAELLSVSQEDSWTETPWGQEITLDNSNFAKGYRTALLSVAQELVNDFDLGKLDTRQISSIKEFIAINL